MSIYLLCFVVSFFFARVAEKSKSKAVFISFSVLSVAVTVLLAGLRDISIGIDTSNVFANGWNVAITARSFWRFLQLYHLYFTAKEYLYAVLIGSVAQAVGNYHVFLTLVHLIIVGGVYVGAFRLRKFASPSFVLLLFYLFYYNHSLNVFRQYMAMAILFAATADIINRHFLRYFVFVAIAVLIHNTAVIGIIPLILFCLLYPNGRLQTVSLSKRLMLGVMVIVGTIMVIPLSRLLLSLGLINQKYRYYLESGSTNSYLLARVLTLLELFVVFILRRSWRNKIHHSNFFVFCLFAFCVLYQIAATIPYGKRIPAYFSMINLATLVMIIKCQRIKNNRIILGSILFAAALSYWLLTYVRYNASATVPYILGV